MPEVNLDRLRGVFAALATPRTRTGAMDPNGIVQLAEFVLSRGVDGLCIGGGTSEYPLFDSEERRRVLREVAERFRGRCTLIAAIGAGNIHTTLDLGNVAIEAGYDALLLPMPHFYPYEQEDLEVFCREVAQSLEVPILLYNLSSFTSRLDPETSIRLMKTESNIIGLKDSSGEEAALSSIARSRKTANQVLLCGADRLFLPSLREGWDGTISGIASFCPEILVAVYRTYRSEKMELAQRYQELLDELVQAVNLLPFPWTIRIGVEVRGIPTGPLAIPQSESRRIQIDHVEHRLRSWLDEHLPEIKQGLV